MGEPGSAREVETEHGETRDGKTHGGESRAGETSEDTPARVLGVEQRLRATRIRSEESRGEGSRGGERFRRAQRLRSSRDFQYVRRRGRSLGGQLLALAYSREIVGPRAATGQTAPSRIGFSVSKRVGKAVVRNLVKRRLRESIRRDLSRLAPGWDIVITARPAAAHASYDQLCSELNALLVRARLLPG